MGTIAALVQILNFYQTRRVSCVTAITKFLKVTSTQRNPGHLPPNESTYVPLKTGVLSVENFLYVRKRELGQKTPREWTGKFRQAMLKGMR